MRAVDGIQRRMTKQRQVILEVVQKTRSHPTADAVYAMVRKRLPHISLATVYRNLDLLVQDGTISRLASGAGPARYDGTDGAHCHLRCTKCQAVVDLPPVDVEDLVATMEDSTGCRIAGYTVEFMGYCARCAKKDNSRPVWVTVGDVPEDRSGLIGDQSRNKEWRKRNG